MEQEGLEIQEILYLIRKKIVIIILITLGVMALAGIYGFFIKKPMYTGTVKIFSGKTEEAQNYTTTELESNAILVNTYIQLIKTDNFMNKVIAESGIDISPGILKNEVKFSTDQKTPILEISYTNKDKDIAEKIITAITVQLPIEVKETILNINTKVIEDVKVIEAKVNKNKLLVLGGVIGLIFSIGIVLLIDFMDNTVKSKKELEKLIPVPVLGELNKEKRILK